MTSTGCCAIRTRNCAQMLLRPIGVIVFPQFGNFYRLLMNHTSYELFSFSFDSTSNSPLRVRNSLQHGVCAAVGRRVISSRGKSHQIAINNIGARARLFITSYCVTAFIDFDWKQTNKQKNRLFVFFFLPGNKI